MNTEYKQFKKDCQKMFSYYGFTETPLDNSQLTTLYLLQYDIGEVYTIGRDVASGYDFKDILKDQLGEVV